MTKNRSKLDKQRRNISSHYLEMLYPSVLRLRFNFDQFFEVAVHEGEIYQALLVNKYYVGGSGTVRNGLRKLSSLNLLTRPRRREPRKGREVRKYRLSAKGLLVAIMNPNVQAKEEIGRFFEKIGVLTRANSLMQTLKVFNWLTKADQHRSLLVDLVEGMAKLGWNLQYIDDKELNKRVLLLWAMAFAIQGEEDFLHTYAQRAGEPMTGMLIASQLAKKMKSREEFLKEIDAKKPDFIIEWRLDTASFVGRYYEIQDLISQRFTRAAQMIPSKQHVLGIPKREKVLLANNPAETLVCFQQDELLLHLDYVWPETVSTILAGLLGGNGNFTLRLPLSIKCLAEDKGLCIREGSSNSCNAGEDRRMSKCPVLRKRAKELYDNLCNQMNQYSNFEQIKAESDRVNWKNDNKKGTYHFHLDIVPFSR